MNAWNLAHLPTATAAAGDAAGRYIIDAGLGVVRGDDRRLSVLPSVVEALRRMCASQAAAYAPPFGDPVFLEAIRAELRLPAHGDSPLAVATPGATGAIHAVLGLVSAHGDTVLMPSARWPVYDTICSALGRRVRTFFDASTHPASWLEHLDVAATAVAARQGSLSLCLCDPCDNPTGRTLSRQECEALAAVLHRHSESVPVSILIDGAYRDYATRESLLPTVISERAPRVVVAQTWSASKSLLQYGLRVGALVLGSNAVSSALRQRFDASASAAWGTVHTAGQAVASRYFADGAFKRAVRAERDEVRSLLARRHREFHACAAAANLTHLGSGEGFFAAIPHPDANRVAAQLGAAGVVVVPLSGLVRVALSAVREADIPRLVEMIARAAAP